MPLRRDVPPFNASASDRMCSTGARWTRGVETFALPNHRLRLGVPARGGRCFVRRDIVKATGSCHANSCNRSYAVSVLFAFVVVFCLGIWALSDWNLFVFWFAWCFSLSVGGDKYKCALWASHSISLDLPLDKTCYASLLL